MMKAEWTIAAQPDLVNALAQLGVNGHASELERCMLHDGAAAKHVTRGQ